MKIDSKSVLKIAVFSFFVALLGMGLNDAYASLSDSVKNLPMPDITINPKLGPVGSEITINVSNLPKLPSNTDERVEFYMYLPAYEDYGTPLTKCNDYCIVLYSFDDIKEGNTMTKEITFALPSTKNPEPTSTQLELPFKTTGIKDGAEVDSVCDVKINGITEYRLGYSCNNYDTPIGEYEIDFGWAVGIADVYDKKQTVTFTVTNEPYQFKGVSYDATKVSPTQWSAGSSDLIFKQYEQGKLTEAQFLQALENQGWETNKDVRRAMALVGSLEHQNGITWIDEDSRADYLSSLLDENPKTNTVQPLADSDSPKSQVSKTSSDSKVESSVTQANSVAEEAVSSIVYAIVIGGVISGGAIFAAFGRHIF